MAEPSSCTIWVRRSEPWPFLVAPLLKVLVSTIENTKPKPGSILGTPGVLLGLCLFGLINATAQTTVVEDFEGYLVANQGYLDPTTVPGSGWTREGVGAADWEVHCCSGSLGNPSAEDNTFDGSGSFLVLRRANPTSPSRSDEITEFTFPSLAKGSLRFQLNPANNTADPFRLALYDSASGRTAMQMVYTESRWWISAGVRKFNSADFRVFDHPGNLIISEIQLDGEPDAYDRWYNIIFTMQTDGTFNLEITDIGPTAPTSATADVPARGVLASVSNMTAGVLGVDTFRLERGPGGGGGEKPSMVDNITITRDEGLPVVGLEISSSMEIPFGTETAALYQLQGTDDLTSGIWTALGSSVLGDGTTKSGLASTTDVPNRIYRVVVF